MLFRISSLWFCFTSAVCNCLAHSLLSFLGLHHPRGPRSCTDTWRHTHTCVRTCTDAVTHAQAVTKNLLCVTCCKTPASGGADGPLQTHTCPCTVHVCDARAGGRPRDRTSVHSCVGSGVQTMASAHACTPVWEATCLVAVTAPAWGTAALKRTGASGPRKWPNGQRPASPIQSHRPLLLAGL